METTLDFYQTRDGIIAVTNFGTCEICGQDLSEFGCTNSNCINFEE
jgi:hypothetical protein